MWYGCNYPDFVRSIIDFTPNWPVPFNEFSVAHKTNNVHHSASPGKSRWLAADCVIWSAQKKNLNELETQFWNFRSRTGIFNVFQDVHLSITPEARTNNAVVAQKPLEELRSWKTIFSIEWLVFLIPWCFTSSFFIRSLTISIEKYLSAWCSLKDENLLMKKRYSYRKVDSCFLHIRIFYWE